MNIKSLYNYLKFFDDNRLCFKIKQSSFINFTLKTIVTLNGIIEERLDKKFFSVDIDN